MTKRLFALLVLLFVLVLTACGGKSDDSSTSDHKEATDNNEASSEEQIVLKVADAFPTTHPVSEHGATYFMERVEELTNNKVTFEYFPAEQLGDAQSLLDIVQTKTADIAYVGAGYVTDKMPLLGVSQLPGLYQTSVEGSRAYWKLVNDEIMADELEENNVKVVFVNASPPYQIATTNKKVETFEDFKGLRVRTTGGIQDLTASSLGLVPVQMSGGDLYTALERKTIDGSLLAYSSWPAYQFDEILNYASTNVPLGSAAVTYMINLEVFNELPEDVQEAILQAGEETTENLAALGDQGEETLSQQYKEAGIDIYEMDESELAKVTEALGSVWEEWYTPLNDKGLPAKDVLDRFLEFVEE